MQVQFTVQAQEDGTPLAGALVGCAVYGGDHPRGTLRTLRTDAAGAVTFDFPGTAEQACLFAAAAGRTPLRLEMHAADRLPALLQLPPGVTFAGRVRDAAGEPVAHAEIDLVIEGPNWIGNGANLGTGDGSWPPQCRTDAVGRFALEWFDPRWCHRDEAHVGLQVSHPDREVQVVSIDRHLQSTGTCELDIVLATGLELTGTVRDASGNPVADAQVEAWHRPRPAPMSACHRRRGRTGPDGAFRLRGLEAAVHDLEVVARGAAPFRTKVDPRTGSHLDLRLRRGSSLEGTLLDATGQPQAGQLVQASKLLKLLFRQATTDGDGRFRIDGLPRRGRITVRAGSDVNQTIRLPTAPVVRRAAARQRSLQLSWLGDTFTSRVSRLAPAAPFAVFVTGLQSTAPVSLTPFGMPGCVQLVAPAATELRFGTGGSVDWSLAIPNTPSLLNVRLFQQAFAPDAAANALGLTASNGIQISTGIR